MALIKIPMTDEDGKPAKLEISAIETVHEDAKFENIFSWATLRKRYFVSYLVGLVCAYVPPVSYLLNDPHSALQVA